MMKRATKPLSRTAIGRKVEEDQIKQIIEAALLASDGPLTVANLTKLFAPGELNDDTATKDVRAAIKSIEEDCATRGVELKRVASGYRFQVTRFVSVGKPVVG